MLRHRFSELIRHIALPVFVLGFAAAMPVEGQEPAPDSDSNKSTNAVPVAEVGPDEFQSLESQFTAAFDKADEEGLLALFAPDCEVIDEAGTLHQGKDEIRDMIKTFFGQFPGAKIHINPETVRSLGSQLMVEEGTRLIAAGNDGSNQASLRYMTLYTKVDGKWLIASIRDFDNQPPHTVHDHLEPIGWLVGDWVNEGTDAIVKINFQWTEDKFYLLGEYQVHVDGEVVRKTSQRLGWDPLKQRIRSWTFDSDGGFSDGHWVATDAGWLVKTESVTHDGQSASATIHVHPESADQFKMSGFDRIIGSEVDDEFEIVVTRQPPKPAK
jgi:uncharacterized protein (TIGR02246 family)